MHSIAKRHILREFQRDYNSVMQSMITMVMVSDMDRSVRFYRETVGLKLRFQSPDWTEFDIDSSTLALHSGGVPALPQTKSDMRAARVSASMLRTSIKSSKN